MGRENEKFKLHTGSNQTEFFPFVTFDDVPLKPMGAAHRLTMDLPLSIRIEQPDARAPCSKLACGEFTSV